MEAQAEVKSWQPSMKLYAGFFLFMLLLSLDNVHSAEVAAKGHGWHLDLGIAAPWIGGLLVGAILYLAPKRNQISEQTAGVLLMLLAFVVSYSYEAMDELARLIHWSTRIHLLLFMGGDADSIGGRKVRAVVGTLGSSGFCPFASLRGRMTAKTKADPLRG